MTTQEQITPGQWSPLEIKFGWCVEAPGSHPSSRVTVCTVHETAMHPNQNDRAEHDARLIARAPDLLAENARLIGVIQSHADAGLVAQTALRAENERLKFEVATLQRALREIQTEANFSEADGAFDLGEILIEVQELAGKALLGKGDA